MSIQMIEVPMKFELVRNGEVVETRRTRLVNPSFEAVAAVGAGWSRGKSTTLQYVDDEGDLVTMDTEGEWCECMRLWRSGVANKALVVRLVLPSLEGGKGRGPCWWRKAAERCRSRSRSGSRSREEQGAGAGRSREQEAERCRSRSRSKSPCNERQQTVENLREWAQLPTFRSKDMGAEAGEQCKGCDYMTTGVAPGHCCWACMSGTSQHGPMCMRQQQPQQPEKAHTDVVEGETAVEEAHMDVVEEAVQEQCSGCNISLPEGVAGMCCEQCANNNKREEKEPEHLLWVPEVPPLSPVEALLPFQSSVAGSSPVLVDVPECEGTSICGSIESLTHELVDPVPAPELELDEQDEVPVPVEVEAPAPAEVEYAQQITALQGMGFPVDGTLLAALKVNNGDLAKAVNMLLM